MTVRKAKAIELLFTEMNTRFPNRTKISDGWLGDAAHRSRTSDHNAWIVDPSGDRIVSAGDITEDAEGGFSEIVDFMVQTLVENRDPRVKYIIHEGLIWRSYDKPGIPAWTPAPYDGPNGHFQHGHVSVLPEKRFYDSTKSWGLLTAKSPEPEMNAVQKARRHAAIVALELQRTLDDLDTAPKRREVVKDIQSEFRKIRADVAEQRARLDALPDKK